MSGPSPADGPGARPDAATAGLCASCRHARLVTSDRGSTFILCVRSRTDPGYPRYPRLPVRSCDGFEVRGPDGTGSEA